MTDPAVEEIIRQSIGSARLAGHEFSLEMVDRIRRLAYGEITEEEAIAEIVAACMRRQAEAAG